MKWLKRFCGICIYLILANYILIITRHRFPLPLVIAGILLFCTAYVLYQILPVYWKKMTVRLQALSGGYELILVTGVSAVAEVAFLVWFGTQRLSNWGEVVIFLLNILVAVILGFLMMLNGFLRIIATSTQISLFKRLAWLLLWWVPVLNLWLTFSICHAVRMEYEFELSKIELNEVRRENECCKTRYPVVMVHGVFFRDWQYFNYWGRIPKELNRNGCTVYYGKQQSAASVETSARELKERVLSIIEETGCEKVNLIAHSKGGLDSRYAISRLGLAPYVASLTTINTPHLGCCWVDQVLARCPKKLLSFVAAKYNRIFSKLGDASPDFEAAVFDLTHDHCSQFNEETGDYSDILCQSVMSRMSSMFSDGVPCNIGYLLVKHCEGVNDGLVCADSAVWGKFLGYLDTPGRRGISHGDMIDLRRENIRGFDVREFYVELVKKLKEQGY
ncbi:esterase/lipase family protein [Diplocloster agilis]|uniref:esterase/lipase family protein n=1 Tax=Diplocloster agilis TaxID=2850323 RepID=UPI000820E5C0|nr:triacylglycerol lipase [Suonthocola fibrivorans]MCU6732834.1 triacylglycerol lipase [Suonthocola fibrivorans]SCI64672.1 Lipase precursor [uncultured Clostridium sp.]